MSDITSRSLYQQMPDESGHIIKVIAEQLYPFNYSVTSLESTASVNTFCEFADFTRHTFDSGSETRGWVIPKGWEAVKAEISHNGQLIHDCLGSTPLGCAYLSPSFQGRVNKEELLRHCSWREDLPEATVYDWTRLYRQGEKKWGLSVPWSVLEKLPYENLDIEIVTREYDCKMNVLDLYLPGSSEEEILFNAHNCHPFQANDDISGCATLIALFNRYLKSKKFHFSYRLLIGPELFAPMFWLDRNPRLLKNIKACILLKSVGNDSGLKVQNSFSGISEIDKVARVSALRRTTTETEFHAFRTYYGNDETVFEATGFQIPSITFTRFPFPEYHTDQDTPLLLSPAKLNETYEALVDLIDIVESNMVASDVAAGLYCLSNHKYDLYRKAPEPGISSEGTTMVERKWNLLMNCLQRDLQSGLSIVDLSLKYDLDYFELRDYLYAWESKGLVSLKRAVL